MIPSVFENGRVSEEVEENGLKMRTREPRRGGVGTVKDPALGNDGVVEFAGGVEGEVNGGARETGEEIFEEVDFEEIVDEGDESNGGSEEVVPGWDERERVEQELVAIGGR